MSKERATFGGGCFWCTEAIFQRLKGVSQVLPGYAGGKISNPSYDQVSMGNTGHVEVIQLEFDPEQISYDTLLDIFWHTHNPTTFNRQGSDVGEQYQSVIFYHDEEQKKLAEKSKQALIDLGEFKDPIVTRIAPLKKFYQAENYHHNYYQQHQGEAYCSAVIDPKLKKLLLKYGDQVKEGYK